jgi:hypothetical protein
MSDKIDADAPEGLLVRIVRWVARLGSLASLVIVILFVIGERANPLQMGSADQLIFLCFPAAVLGGVLLAWFWEFGGAVFALAGLTAFYGSTFFLAGTLPRDWRAVAAAAPAVLFLASAMLRRLARKKGAVPPGTAP